MNSYAYFVSELAPPLQEGLTNLLLVAIILLFEIHVGMIVPASTVKLALPLLVQLTGLFPVFEGLLQLPIVVSIVAGEPMPALRTMDTHLPPVV